MIGIREGYGKHIATLPFTRWTVFFKYLYAFQLLYCPAIMLVKFSIIATQYRMFRVIQYRRILMGCSVFVACLFVSQVLVVIFSCIPVSNYWETFTLGARCIDVVGAIRINGGINAATDFILLAMVHGNPSPLYKNVGSLSVQAHTHTVEAANRDPAEVDFDLHICNRLGVSNISIYRKIPTWEALTSSQSMCREHCPTMPAGEFQPSRYLM